MVNLYLWNRWGTRWPLGQTFYMCRTWKNHRNLKIVFHHFVMRRLTNWFYKVQANQPRRFFLTSQTSQSQHHLQVKLQDSATINKGCCPINLGGFLSTTGLSATLMIFIMYKRIETCIHLLYELMVLVKAGKYRDSEIDAKVDTNFIEVGRIQRAFLDSYLKIWCLARLSWVAPCVLYPELCFLTTSTHNPWFLLFYHVWGLAWIEIHWNSMTLTQFGL